jgi:hypothetical protein
MPEYRLGGVPVSFPFPAYDCQIVYMERVIEALQQVCIDSSASCLIEDVHHMLGLYKHACISTLNRFFMLGKGRNLERCSCVQCSGILLHL